VRGTRTLAAALALCAAAVAGCGLGPGKDEGDVQLTISRDFGHTVMEHTTDSIKESDDVLRVLDRNAEITTRYGGRFVQSIDGLAGGESGGRRTDWFFYVNGIESPVGGADYDLSDGDRIWWDHHDWTSAMRVPAVVGSWPEPFVHGFRKDRWPAAVDCRTSAPVCGKVSVVLRTAGADLSGGGSPIQVEVGPWDRIESVGSVDLLAKPPSESGVYANFSGDRRSLLNLLNERGEISGSLGHGAGLVAALRSGDGPPTWVVTGTDKAGVMAAARLVGPSLTNHFAVATDGGQPIPVPVP